MARQPWSSNWGFWGFAVYDLLGYTLDVFCGVCKSDYQQSSAKKVVHFNSKNVMSFLNLDNFKTWSLTFNKVSFDFEQKLLICRQHIFVDISFR